MDVAQYIFYDTNTTNLAFKYKLSIFRALYIAIIC